MGLMANDVVPNYDESNMGKCGKAFFFSMVVFILRRNVACSARHIERHLADERTQYPRPVLPLFLSPLASFCEWHRARQNYILTIFGYVTTVEKHWVTVHTPLSLSTPPHHRQVYLDIY